MAAVAAVAVVAMQPHHRRRGFEQVVGLDKGDRGGEPRVGLGHVVGHAVAAAEQKIVALKPLALPDRHDRQIVGQDVDRVVLGDRQPDLEFARQIALAIERVGGFGRRRLVRPFLAVHPDLVIGAGLRQQMGRQPPCVGFEPVVDRVADRRRHRRHRAHDIAARRQGRQQRAVDRADRGLQSGFDDAVELDALPGGDPQRPVGPAFGDPVEAEILLGREPPARNPHPDHELPDLVVAALLARGGGVAVIALIDAVKFEQRIALLVERRAGVGEVAGDDGRASGGSAA